MVTEKLGTSFVSPLTTLMMTTLIGVRVNDNQCCLLCIIFTCNLTQAYTWVFQKDSSENDSTMVTVNYMVEEEPETISDHVVQMSLIILIIINLYSQWLSACTRVSLSESPNPFQHFILVTNWPLDTNLHVPQFQNCLNNKIFPSASVFKTNVNLWSATLGFLCTQQILVQILKMLNLYHWNL